MQANNSIGETPHNWPFDGHKLNPYGFDIHRTRNFLAQHRNLIPILNAYPYGGVLSFNAHVHSNHRDYHCNLDISTEKNRLTILQPIQNLHTFCVMDSVRAAIR